MFGRFGGDVRDIFWIFGERCVGYVWGYCRGCLGGFLEDSLPKKQEVKHTYEKTCKKYTTFMRTNTSSYAELDGRFGTWESDDMG